MRRQKLPNTDSVEELAKFWDTHDLTDFEEDLEEAGELVFRRAKGTSLSIDLQPTEAQRLKEIAQSKGVRETTVLRQWILETLHESFWTGRPPSKALHRARQKAARPRLSRQPDTESTCFVMTLADKIREVVERAISLERAEGCLRRCPGRRLLPPPDRGQNALPLAQDQLPQVQQDRQAQ